MDSFFMSDWEFILRILLSALCGMAIGVERERHLKDAGVRTHMVVALGAALMMVVSKYGFMDIALLPSSIDADASRIAAQIVSGIGFLGAGVILVRERSITGLTTAAGVWATAGIAMALGAGMYLIGISCTVMIVVTQTVLQRHHAWLHLADSVMLNIKVAQDGAPLTTVLETVERHKARIVNVDIFREQHGALHISIHLRPDTRFPVPPIMEDLLKLPGVNAVHN